MAGVVYILDLLDWKLSKCPVRVSRRGKCPIQPVRLFQYYIVVNIHNPSVFSWTLCDLQDKLHIHCHNFAGLTTCAQNDLLGQGNRRSSQLKVHRNGKSYILIPQNAALILGIVEKKMPATSADTKQNAPQENRRCARLGSRQLAAGGDEEI